MRRGLRIIVRAVAALLLLVVLLLAVFWWWAGSSGSLAQALLLLQTQLQTQSQTQAPTQEARSAPLTFSGVTGSLRRGGQVESLQWQQAGLSVAVNQLELAWQPLALLHGRLEFNQLSAANVQIKDQGIAPSSAATGPPISLGLPLQVLVEKFSLAQLGWSQAQAEVVEASNIAGRYDFDGLRHRLDLSSAAFASGAYHGQAELTSRSPLTLKAELLGSVALAVPSRDNALPLDFKASLQGPISALDLAASLLAKTQTESLPNAELSARITPWAAQPVQQASASFKDLNLAALWPSAPQTQLSGTASVRPKADTPALSAWQMQIDGRNALPGPWDEKKLPLESLQADGEWINGAALVRSLQAEIAGGKISAQGQWMAATNSRLADQSTKNAAPSSWQLEAKISRLQPAKLLRRLSAPALSGQASLQSLATGGIDFSAALRTSGASKTTVAKTQFAKTGIAKAEKSKAKKSKAQPSLLTQLQLQSLTAKGNYNFALAGGTLTLSALEIKTDDAQISGSLQAQIAAQAGQADLVFQAPGLNATLIGASRPASGNGQLQLQLSDAALALAWIRQLPWLPEALTSAIGGAVASGNADLKLHWQGGWKDPQIDAKLAVPRLDWKSQSTEFAATTPTASAAAKSAVNAAAAAPAMQLSAATLANTAAASAVSAVSAASAAVKDAATNPGSGLSLRNTQAQLSGQLSQAEFKLNGELLAGERRLQLALSAAAGQSADVWQGAITQFGLALQDPALGSGSWRIDTVGTIPLKWRNAVSGAQFELAAGQAWLSPPSRVNSGVNSGMNSGMNSSVNSGINNTKNNTKTSAATAARIAWQTLSWSRQEFSSAGKITGLPLAWIELLSGPQLAGAGLAGNLVFDAQWDARLSDTLRLNASLARSSGDLTVQAETGANTRIAAGVRQASISLASDGEKLNLALRWDSQRAGNAEGKISTRLSRSADAGWLWPADAPLDGQLRAQLPRLGVWSVLAPPGWRIRGALATDLRLSGNRAAPQLAGSLAANDLALRSVVDGFEFGRGRLRATLVGTQMRIDEFSLQGAGDKGTGGALTAQGQAAWVNGQAQVQLNAKINALRASIRSDRQLTVSGNLQASLQGKNAKLEGSLNIDRGRIVLPEEGTPQLGDDVVVRSSSGMAVGSKAPAQVSSQAKAQAQDLAQSNPGSSFSVAVKIDLGRDFQVQGKGLQTRIAGQLLLTAQSGSEPRLIGTVNTVGGQYRAYGQALDVEQGLLRFTGAIDNPSLDILAIRPNLTQRVGVQITGTALLPRVRLYAQPELPDAEKLSWLVLGRSSASGGGETALLQQAALALLGNRAGGLSGGLAASLGLDELSYKGASTNSDGSTAAGAVTLGKRFSRNFYAAYERSVSGALGSLYIFYDLSQRFTLRAQTGQQSAVDLIFTIPYD